MNHSQINPNTPKNKLDTPDFLAFSDSTPEFCPSNSSSPQKQWRHNPRNNWNSRYSGSFRKNPYNSPSESGNRSFNKSFSNSNSSFSNSWSRNNSFNSSKNTSSSDGGANMHNYLHTSFIENPWAKLEKQALERAQRRSDTHDTSEDSTEGALEP